MLQLHHVQVAIDGKKKEAHLFFFPFISCPPVRLDDFVKKTKQK